MKGCEANCTVLWRFLEFKFYNVSENYSAVKVDVKQGLRQTIKTYRGEMPYFELYLHQE